MEHEGTLQLETKRLLLRQFKMEDAKAMYKNRASDSAATHFLTWPAHLDISVTENILRERIIKYKEKSYYQWAIILKEIDEPIGSISVVNSTDGT